MLIKVSSLRAAKTSKQMTKRQGQGYCVYEKSGASVFWPYLQFHREHVDMGWRYFSDRYTSPFTCYVLPACVAVESGRAAASPAQGAHSPCSVPGWRRHCTLSALQAPCPLQSSIHGDIQPDQDWHTHTEAQQNPPLYQLLRWEKERKAYPMRTQVRQAPGNASKKSLYVTSVESCGSTYRVAAGEIPS